jgi:hypothetical protein
MRRRLLGLGFAKPLPQFLRRDGEHGRQGLRELFVLSG